AAHIEILNGLASLYFQTGRYHKSERLTLECLGLEERRPSPDRVAIARQIANLAAVCQNQRRYAEADEHYLRALNLFETAAGTPPPEIAFTLNNLGSLRALAGKPQEGIPYVERAIAIWESSLDRAHPVYAQALGNIA